MAEFTHAVVDTEDGRVYAGAVMETNIAGAFFLRLTVPSGQYMFFRGDGLRCITPCTPAFAQVAGQVMAQPLAHIHIPEMDEAVGAGADTDDLIYQNGYEDGEQAGYERAMEEYAEQHAFEEAEASALQQDIAKDRQRVLLPGDPGFPHDSALPGFLQGEAA